MTSNALSDLGGRLDEVRVLSKLDPARTGDTSQPATSNAINRGCIVLLCSHLEGFLEDLAIESLDALASFQAPVAQLPLILRALHVEDHLKELEPIKDRKARAPRIEKMFADEGGFWTFGSQISTTMLRPKTVCSQMSNPGSKEVRQFLDLLGVDIEGHLRETGSLSLLHRINGLVGNRNSIAHGERGVNPTSGDVDTYLTLVEDLSREIDSALANAVKGICSLAQLPW
ncbi:MAE_28990/MAE_18760 family HEPN-like nuclease [Micromonospora carbonacea]|uniref:MAE_28990/MAE_18760 family HEPN-like nuclease n=1 Tax=Micromonospora carbonacea TaxID=47853 RepID=UPI00114D2B13|nr:MAE_28990/MAE_18760 family HEPN-like nuclease [Micromonospora carbonacea]